jgi:gliding motility-associated-like protein
MRLRLSFLVVLLFIVNCMTGQWGDCDNSVDACTNPSFNVTPSGFGNVEEFDAMNFGISNPQVNPNTTPGNMGCLMSGELNSTWLLITVTGPGTLEFSMGTAGTFNCFDWIMWPYDPAATCNDIANNIQAPVACNWNGACTGITGMANAGNLPAGGDQTDFENGLNVNAGDQFMICFSNFSSASTGVPLDFFGTAQVTCGNTIGATICSGENAFVVALGGVAYNWDTAIPGFINTNALGDTAYVNPSVTTNYMVDITMGNGQVQQDVVTVTVHPLLNGIGTGTDETCLDSLDGSISASAPGGLAPISYTLSGAGTGTNTTGSFINLGEGNYIIDMVDANGCLDQVLVTLNPGPVCCSMTLTTSGTDVSCFGVCDGTATVDTNGTTPPVIIQWFDATMTAINGATGLTLTGLCAGTYFVQATDVLCTIIEEYIVSEPTALTFTASITNPLCFQGNTGSIDVSANGGTLPYQYSIDNGALFQAGFLFDNLTEGNYILIIEDANGCQVTGIENLTEPAELIINLQATNNLCNSANAACDGNALVTANGGSSPLTYNWSGGIAGSNDLLAEGLCQGNYLLTVVDDNDCFVDTAFVISEPQLFGFQTNVLTIPSCNNLCDGAIEIISNGAISYSLDNGVTTQGDPLFLNLCSGTYDLLVVNEFGCASTMNENLSLQNQVTAQFNTTPESTSFFQSEIDFINTSENAFSYFWTVNENGIDNLFYTENISYTFPGDMPGTYPVCLVAYDDNNCTDTVCRDIVIEDEFFVYVPNAFTPNNDGINDFFTVNINGHDESMYQLIIFDKWGEVLFLSDSPNMGWDGTYQGDIVEQDVYVWHLKARERTTIEEREFFGHVSLIR